jgi:C-6 monooxygenase
MAANAEVQRAADASASEQREFVQVVQFGVADYDQSKLIQVLADEVERWVRACPGFISCQLHASQDGKSVFSYARWQTEAAFRDYTSHPETAALSAAIHSFGPTSGPESASYHLMRCVFATSADVRTEPLVTLATS